MDRTEIILTAENETIKLLVELIGVKNTINILDNFGGSHIYIPSIETIERKHRNYTIYKDFVARMDYSSLRRKYKLSEKTVREIINNQRKELEK